MAKVNRRAEASRQADEDILKTTMLLQMQRGHAYVSELSEELEMNIATAYSAVTKLAADGYLLPLERRGGRKSNKQSLTFTSKGEALANAVLERHQTIMSWLLRLGVPEDEADLEACHMEHGITDRTMKILQQHVRMASEMMGDQSQAADVMRRMSEQLNTTQQPGGVMVKDKIVSLIERYGGMDGVARKGALVARAGGEEALTQLLDLVDSLGGYRALAAKKDQMLALDKLVEQQGGIDNASNGLHVLSELGGAKKSSEICEWGKRLGGVDMMLKLLQNGYSSWEAVFEKR